MMADPDPSNEVTLALVMQRLSRHLSLLANRAKGLEDALGVLAETSPEAALQLSERLQDADFLRQSVDDLCLLTHFLSSRPTDTPLNEIERQTIAAELRLAATKMLLDISPFDPSQAEGAQNAGEPLLF